MGVNQKRILILADSLGLPRDENEDVVKYYNTWPSLFSQNFKQYEIINYSTRKRTIVSTFGQIDEIKLMEPHLIIFQIGVVDCAPRIFSEYDKKWLKKMPNFLKYWIINYRKKRRVKLQSKDSLNKVYVKPDVFKETYINLINALRYGFENLQVIILPIIANQSILDLKSPGFNDNISLYNKILVEVAESANAKLLDLSDINSYGKFCSDGYHVNEFGNELIFKKVSELISD